MAQSHVSIAAAGKRRRRSARRLMRRVRRARPVSCLILTLIAVIMLIPIVFTFLYSFFPKSEISSYLAQRGSYDQSRWMDILFSPAQVSLRQYYTILIEEPQYLQLFCNSVLYAGAILVGQALVIPLTAYALSRFQFRGRDALFFLVLVLMVLPFQVTMVSRYLVLDGLGLLDTVWAVILPGAVSTFPVFLMVRFFAAIPSALTEAAALAGVMATGMASAAGRLLAPWLSDRLGRRNVLFLLYGITLVSILLLTFAQSYFFIVLIALISFAFGGSAGVYPAVTADYFGIKNNGTNYGLVMIAFAASGLMFPAIATVVTPGGIPTAWTFLVPAIASVAGIFVTLALKRDAAKKPA